MQARHPLNILELVSIKFLRNSHEALLPVSSHFPSLLSPDIYSQASEPSLVVEAANW